MSAGIPEHYHSVTTMVVFKDAREAIEFYKRAFGEIYDAHQQWHGQHSEQSLGGPNGGMMSDMWSADAAPGKRYPGVRFER
jgi:uncharacterized glyoxalase superfamily protein PhnB